MTISIVSLDWMPGFTAARSDASSVRTARFAGAWAARGWLDLPAVNVVAEVFSISPVSWLNGYGAALPDVNRVWPKC